MNPPNEPQQFDDQPRKANFVWAGAVLLVLFAWAAAFVLRGGEKVVIEGWQDGIEAGMAQAEASDRPMVVLFTAGWCGPCQQFKRDVLYDTGVQVKLSESFVPVQVDLTDRSSDKPNLDAALRYGVESIPRLIVMDAKGEFMGVYTGEWEPGVFKKWLIGHSQDALAAR